MPTTPSEAEGRWVVLFDGGCALCDAAIRFVIDHDPAGKFAFAPLQSPEGQAAAARCGVSTETIHTVVLLAGDRCHTRSTAALKIARRLDGPWPLLYGFILVPRPVRDRVYDWVAKNRYRWFGRQDACRVPSPETRRRFLGKTQPGGKS